jgi:hypothetical protein
MPPRSQMHAYDILLQDSQIRNRDDARYNTHHMPVIEYSQLKVQVLDPSPSVQYSESIE